QADVQGALHGVEQRLLAGGVPLGPRQGPLLGPPAVAVHHDPHVVRERPQIEVGQEAHGAAGAGSGSGGGAGSGSGGSAGSGRGCRASNAKLRIRRSRWYSTKPYRAARASRRTVRSGVISPADPSSERASPSSHRAAG